jgi:uncharacterized protein (TIGR00369 family)
MIDSVNGINDTSKNNPEEMNMASLTIPRNIPEWNTFGKEYLPGHMGIEILSVTPDELRARMPVGMQLCAPNGFLHAASVVALADTASGYATINTLPKGSSGFTTIELKTNFIGTSLDGGLHCIATSVHKGRTTQVWDATVKVEQTARTIALFRCTQMILWPKEPNDEEKS